MFSVINSNTTRSFCSAGYNNSNVWLSVIQKITNVPTGTKSCCMGHVMFSRREISSQKQRHRNLSCDFLKPNTAKYYQATFTIAKCDSSTNAKNKTIVSKSTNVQSAGVALKKIKRKSTTSQKLKVSSKPGKDAWSVVGYTTAEAYDLYTLSRHLAVQVTLLPKTE